MNFVRQAIGQPVTVAVGVILIVMAGLLALRRIPIQLTPNVESTIITVTTFWEGASPQEVELNIVDKQEERLLGLANLRQVTSTSSQSMGHIRLEFYTGTDKAEALREVSDKLREVPDYPENVDEPVIQATDRENRDYIAWVVFGTTDPDFDVRILRDFAVDRIEPALERVDGIAEINVLGGREREIQVRVDPVRMAHHGVTPTQFARVIRETNRNFSAGRRAEGKRDVRIRTIGKYKTPQEIEDTVIVDTDAGAVHVRDVAEVVLTYKEPVSFVRSRGQPVIAINAEREIGSNVMEVMDRLKAAIARLNAPDGMLDSEARRLGLNGSLTLTQVYDQTVYIDDALALVRHGDAGAQHQRDQPGGHGLRRGHGGRQRDRGPGEHLPAPGDGQVGAAGRVRRRQRGVGRRAGVDADDNRGLHPDPAHRGGGGPAVPRHRAGHLRRRRPEPARVDHADPHRGRARAEGQAIPTRGH
jgi:HAE1 family hydrophobic/amphiphilic exporter-1